MKFLFVMFAISIVWVDCRQTNVNEPAGATVDYRQAMRDVVIELSKYAKSRTSDFFIIPQNGQELITTNGEPDGPLESLYLQSIDATGREDLFYGYDQDDAETPADETNSMLTFCHLCEQHNIEVLVTDYCSTPAKIDASYERNQQHGFISFAATERELNRIPDYPAAPYQENSNDVVHISNAKNFLYLINSENYESKDDVIRAVAATNYDIVIMDLFHNERTYTRSEIEQLRKKQNNSTRLLMCYMSIGEAEDYRYYWQTSWSSKRPDWLLSENPEWQGNYKVKYWSPEWQRILFAGENSYLDKIIDAGFDGVYLDLIDAFEYFQQ